MNTNPFDDDFMSELDSQSVSRSRLTKKAAAQMNILQLIEYVVNNTYDNQLSLDSVKKVRVATTELRSRLKTDLNDIQLVLLCCFINQYDDPHIITSDLARAFGCKNIRICSHYDDFQAIADRGFIRMGHSPKGDVYQVPAQVMVAFRENRAYERPSYAGLTEDRFWDAVSEIWNLLQQSVISRDDFDKELRNIITPNKQLRICSLLGKQPLDEDEMALFVVTALLFMQNRDDHVTGEDVDDLFESRGALRQVVRQVMNDTHQLFRLGFFEHGMHNGMAAAHEWCLTDMAKQLLFADMNIVSVEQKQSGLIKAEDITEKHLFYRPETAAEMCKLTSMFGAERFRSVQDSLEAHGMRKGVACIFYGGPGTGKTEGVLQLARQTGRPLMQVDISQMRDKYVGETEKMMKQTFARYRQFCKDLKVQPILFFNEADAVFCKRIAGAETGVDKMENALQNIILQEMETLDGILICTTNLADNLDPAFERRFLYKMEFLKPTPEEARHIWQAMLPELSDEEAKGLAEEFSFSGGQIENISRKMLINSLLDGDSDKSQLVARIRKACQTENFRKNQRKSVGFAS